MNKFAKLDEQKNIVYAKIPVDIDGVKHYAPSDETYLAAGFKPVIDERPYTSPTEYAVAVGWEEFENSISRIYEIRPIEPQPRRWTPLTMKRGALKRGWWQAFKGALEAADMYDDFLMCQYIAENDAAYPAIYAAMCQLFGKEEVDTYLAELEVE